MPSSTPFEAYYIPTAWVSLCLFHSTGFPRTLTTNRQKPDTPLSFCVVPNIILIRPSLGIWRTFMHAKDEWIFNTNGKQETKLA